MNIENNKMQVDIENLIKQNVNDLSSIKELYSKLKEVQGKISQIKYIDSNLANKIKKEYEKLEKIILDENIQIKLTNDVEAINSQMDNIVNVRQTIHVSDYITNSIDNTEDIQNVVDRINSTKGGVHVLFDVKRIIVKKSFVVSVSNVTIDFCNCEVVFNGVISGNNGGTIGFLTFNGNIEGEQIKITNIEKEIGNIFSNGFMKLTLEDTSTISKGDFIFVAVGDNNNLGLDTDILEPRFKRLCKVIYKTDNVIGIDYYNPWSSLKTTTVNEYSTRYIQKVNPLFNIKLSNFNFKDETIANNNWTNLICGLTFTYAFNIELKNINGVNTTQNLVNIIKSQKILLDNLNIKNPQVISDGGKGYGIQFVECHDIYAKNLKGENERHVIDIADGSNAIIENVTSNTTAFGISLHGVYEHDITYKNIIGSLQIGQSGTEFGNASMNIFIESSTARILGLFCDNLVVRNSNVRLSNFMYNSTFENCSISIVNKLFLRPQTNRGLKQPKISFINTTIKDNGSNGYCTIENWDYICFDNSSLVIGEKGLETQRGIAIKNNYNFKFMNSYFEGNIVVQGTNNRSYLLFSNSVLNFKLESGYAFRPYTFTESNISINMNNCTIQLQGANFSLSDNYNVTNSHLLNRINDCEFIGTGKIIYNHINNNKYKCLLNNNFISTDITVNSHSNIVGTNYTY